MSEQRDALAEAQPTHHMHQGDAYGVVPGPAHMCIASVNEAESVFVLTVEEHSRLLADAEQRGAARVTAAVEVIHQSSEVARGVGQQRDGRWTPYCELDGESWPCDTIAALTPAAAQDPA